MNDPERWLETGERGLAQRLLCAALTDGAPDAVRVNVLDAVKGALPELAPTPSASPPHAGGGASGATGGTVSVGVLGRVVLAGAVAHPVAASALVALVITLGAVAHYATPATPREPAPASPAPSPPALPRSEEPEPAKGIPSSREDTPGTSLRQIEARTPSQPASTSMRPHTTRPRLARAALPPQDHLGEQLSLLARARQHLRTGKPDAALSVLTSFERQFPDGALIPEAAVLRQRARRQMTEKALPSGERPPD